MMECMEEFDEATPLKATYCSRLNAEEYEAQGARWVRTGAVAVTSVVTATPSTPPCCTMSSSCTEKALAELLQHLEQRPEAYTSVLKKRRKDEVENERGMVTYFKARILHLFFGTCDNNLAIIPPLYPPSQMKLFSLVGVEDQACSVPDVECEEQLDKLKADMMKAYSYSQGVFSVTGVCLCACVRACVCVCVCVCVCERVCERVCVSE